MPVLDVAAIVVKACSWPGVEAAAGAGTSSDPVVLSAGGRSFARISADGVELTLPPLVRDMLVETGRAVALPSTAHALVTPDDGGAIDLDLLRLAYERARVTTAYRAPTRRTRDQPR